MMGPSPHEVQGETAITTFLDSCHGKIYKILSLKEAGDSGKEVYLAKYLDSLSIELVGACKTFPSVLTKSPEFLSIINTVHGLSQREYKHQVVRSEMFKMQSQLERLKARCEEGGVEDGDKV